MKFEVGDKVRAITNNYRFTSVVNRWEGVVTAINEMYFSAKTTAGYSAGDLFTRLKYKDFELIGYEKSVHIYSDGKTTIAMLKGGKVTVRTAVAKCIPEDEFSLEISAKLALDRLFEQESKKELKYKAGDRVRIVKEKAGKYWNPDGGMDNWLGKTMTITYAHEGECYVMEEDAHVWSWYPWMIEGLAKPLVIRRENKKLEDDNYQKCEIIAELKEKNKKLERENLGLRKQVENMRRKEEARYKSDAWVD